MQSGVSANERPAFRKQVADLAAHAGVLQEARLHRLCMRILTVRAGELMQESR